MPNIFHQSIEDILKAATPEQKIIWNSVFLRFGERVSISQFTFSGTLGAAPEIAVYTARKLYLAYLLQIGTNAFTAGVTAVGALFYDENNVNNFGIGIALPAWDVTAAAMRYSNNFSQANNILFSRINGTGIYINFIGYRIIY